MKIIDGTWDLAAAAHAHRKSVNKDRIRFQFQTKILKAYSENDYVTAVAEIDKAIAAEPALEDVFCTLKLSALIKDRNSNSAARNYATHLIDKCQDDVQSLLGLSIMLFEPRKMKDQGDGLEQESDFLDLALQALHQIENLLGRETPPASITPKILMQFEAHFARALPAGGKIDEALDRVLRALGLGNETSAPDEDMKQLEELVNECKLRLNQEHPAAAVR